jgi:hypothetical protein
MNQLEWTIIGKHHHIQCPHPIYGTTRAREVTTHKCIAACKWFQGVTDTAVICDWRPNRKQARMYLATKRTKRVRKHEG